MKKLLLPQLLLFASLLLSQSKGNGSEFGSNKIPEPNKYAGLGIPYIQNHNPKEYAASGNNYGIVQSESGFMYIGNEDGILEYDGVSWQLIQLHNFGIVRSLAQDDHGRIYVGGIDELGYLEPDSVGQLKFVSLRFKLPTNKSTFGQVWEIHCTAEGIYFNTQEYLFLWSDNQFRIWKNPSLLSTTFHIGNRLFLYHPRVGLSIMEGDSIDLLITEDKFGGSLAMTMLPYGKDKFLIATQKTGLFIWDGTSLTPFESEASGYLKENIIMNGVALSDDQYAFGTYRGGMAVIDKFGAIKTILTKETGLIDDAIISALLDNQGQLWLTTNKGISRVEVSTPLSIYSEKLGIKGVVESIQRHQDLLYVSTSHGLFLLEKSPKGGHPPSFNPISESEIYNFTFKGIGVGDRFLVPTWGGVFEVKQRMAKKLNDYRAGCIYQSKIDTNRFYLGLRDGLASIYNWNNHWIDEGRIAGVDNDIRKIIETQTGDLWAQPQIEGIWKVKFPMPNLKKLRDNNRNIPITRRFDNRNGLPKTPISIDQINGKILFRIDQKFYEYHTNSDSFILNPIISEELGINSGLISKIMEDDLGNVWMWVSQKNNRSGHAVVAARQKDNSYKVTKVVTTQRITQVVTDELYVEPEGIVWFGGTDGIVRYDSRANAKNTKKFSTAIRKVLTKGDSLLYGGAGFRLTPKLNYSYNFLRFRYAAPSFGDKEDVQYKYLLEGFDDSWSSWTKETTKEYTNIPEGNYRFRVNAKNIYGVVGQEDIFDFEINPPWYRTWAAYSVYLILFIGLLWGIIQWRSRQLRLQNEALEKLVSKRTYEVQHQANQLKVQAEKLQELDKAKSRFFANTSHEFRTPLTLIKGPIEQLEQNFNEKLNLETVKMIRRNANRLLNMVNQLLDLSKIDEGSLKLAPTEGDVYKCLRAAASSFNSHAAQRNMDYRVKIPHTVLWASFDRDKLENIMYNLLGNAFKFSGDGSKISFAADYNEYGLRIQVSDAGKGIAAEKLPFIFGRFYQGDNTNTREKGGSGIGLSLSKDLVELMDGTITVSSEVDRGTLFSVQLPVQEIKTRQKKVVEDAPPTKNPVVKRPFVLSNTDKRNLPTILLVEDNADMRHFITEQLVKLYKVKEAMNGEAGLQKAISDSPDLIITDLMMPKMDGIELCKKLKTDLHTSHIPVIMLTAKAGRENKIEGLETGADDYLTKPFDSKELLVRAKNLIEQRQKLRKLFSNRDVHVDPKKIAVTSIDQKFLGQLLTLLEVKFSDSDFGVPQMQDSLAMSKTQLHRKLKALTNEAPGELLRNFRLKRAAQLLSQKADSVTQIAYRVGFNNLSYFAKCFKELYGVAPSSY